MADELQDHYPALADYLESNPVDAQLDDELHGELALLNERVTQIQAEFRRREEEGSFVAFTRDLTEGGPAAPYSDLPDSTPYAPGIDIQLYKELCTGACGVVKPTPSAEHQVIRPKQRATAEIRRFSCIICDSRYSTMVRLHYHFELCVSLNGNPNGFHWFDAATIREHYKKERSG